MNPFLLMAVFYLVLVVLAAADAALTSLSLFPWFVGLPWLRAHFITLGVLTETAFGILPNYVAARRNAPPPPPRWDIWVVLNAGLVLLVAGIPSVTSPLIITGGTLIFVAVIMLIVQLRQLGADAKPGAGSLKYYVTGLVFLLVGILVGTGLWIGWSEPLRIHVPKEVHVHANSWGFASLVFAGMLIDVIPALTGSALVSRRTNNAIFWLMTVGALGLVAGPWLARTYSVTVPGLILHLAATLWLIVALVRELRRHKLLRTASALHLPISYIWILLPVLMAPFVVLKVPGMPAADIEGTAPQALVYGWFLQFLYAILPYFAARWLLRDPNARLGGNWLSLITVNLGSILIWVSIFLVAYRAPIHGMAYVFLTISVVAGAWEAIVITRTALQRNHERLEREAAAASA